MVEIISVRFKEGGRQYYFNPNGERFRLGEGVIVETARGVEFGECTQENTAWMRWSSPRPCARCSAGPPRRIS